MRSKNFRIRHLSKLLWVFKNETKYKGEMDTEETHERFIQAIVKTSHPHTRYRILVNK